MEPKANYLKHSLSNYLTTGLYSGIIAAVLNLLYFFLYDSYANYSVEMISGYRIVIGSLMPGIFAGIIYFIVERIVKKNAFKMYTTFIILGTLISLLGPYVVSLSETVPDPLALYILTFPMQIIVAAVILIMMKVSLS